jgi:hypothetical protein
LDPTLGRFISVDPLVNKTHDAYGYGRNNPMTFTDPSGLDADTGMVLKSAASFNTKLTTLVHYFVQIDISTKISSGNIECKLASGGSIDVCSGSKADNRGGWQIAEVKKNSTWGEGNARSDLRYYSKRLLKEEGVQTDLAVGGLTRGGGRTWPKSASWEANGITISYFQPESRPKANNGGVYLYDYSTNMKAENAADQKALDAMIATIKAMNGMVMVPGLGSMPAPPQAGTAAIPEPTQSVQASSGNSFPTGYSAAAEAEAIAMAAADGLVGAGMNEDR